MDLEEVKTDCFNQVVAACGIEMANNNDYEARFDWDESEERYFLVGIRSKITLQVVWPPNGELPDGMSWPSECG